MKNRRKSRVLALQLMYAWDMRNGDDIEGVFSPIISGFFAGDDEDVILGEGETAPPPRIPDQVDEEIVTYARHLVGAAVERCTELDAMIQQHAANWDIRRMAAVDRNILRIAIAELSISTDVPYKVVIDEAVEIAKEYGSDESGRFVNGVVDAVHKSMNNQE